jgi:hypothetical protein
VAALIVDGSDLVVRMSDVEKFEAIHPDVRVPMSAVRAGRVVDEAWPERSSLRRYGVA